MSRLLFRKTGRAKFISHLDLMRTMQRIFIRAGLKVRHTEGFNPHPYMNFALPLSVGTESECELMDFELTEAADPDAIPALLNRVSPEGIEALKVYDSARKFKEIKWLDIEARLFYDNKTREAERLREFFAAPAIVMEKKTKRSVSDTDIVPLISALQVTDLTDGLALISARLAAQDPGLSPAQLISALEQRAPELAPDHAAFRRIEVYDKDMVLFR